MILPYTVRLFSNLWGYNILYLYVSLLLLYLHTVFTAVISAVIPPAFLITMLVYYKLGQLL